MRTEELVNLINTLSNDETGYNRELTTEDQEKITAAEAEWENFLEEAFMKDLSPAKRNVLWEFSRDFAYASKDPYDLEEFIYYGIHSGIEFCLALMEDMNNAG